LEEKTDEENNEKSEAQPEKPEVEVLGLTRKGSP